jgi:ribosomal protein S18 acetylase RimI-like enzyme
MTPLSISEQHILQLLEEDRNWSAYALADMDSIHKPHSWWFADKTGVVLVYKGFSPPVLFSHGFPSSLERLFQEIPQGDYVYTLQKPSMDLLDHRLTVSNELEMWRMTIQEDGFTPTPTEGVQRLTMDDLNQIQVLFADHPDQPDAFAPSQVGEGVYFGIREGTKLVSLAGTHVLSKHFSVAGVGNIFTRPDRRNRGMGTKVASAVASELLSMRIQTIVLNVAVTNLAAIRSYTHIGFQPYCKYHEGFATLQA